jgi:hypothetical protein
MKKSRANPRTASVDSKPRADERKDRPHEISPKLPIKIERTSDPRAGAQLALADAAESRAPTRREAPTRTVGPKKVSHRPID